MLYLPLKTLSLSCCKTNGHPGCSQGTQRQKQVLKIELIFQATLLLFFAVLLFGRHQRDSDVCVQKTPQLSKIRPHIVGNLLPNIYKSPLMDYVPCASSAPWKRSIEYISIRRPHYYPLIFKTTTTTKSMFGNEINPSLFPTKPPSTHIFHPPHPLSPPHPYPTLIAYSRALNSAH